MQRVRRALVPARCGRGREDPAHDAHLEPRIASIAHAVAQIRGLSFNNPVPIEFVPTRRFESDATGRFQPVSKADRRFYQEEGARMQALGLIPAGTDLAKVYTSLHGSGVLAYYDPALKKMVIKGTKLDVYTRVTVAHELTHALDDQNFNLGRVERGADDGASALAIRSLVEGDATWVMLRYEGNLGAGTLRVPR